MYDSIFSLKTYPFLILLLILLILLRFLTSAISKLPGPWYTKFTSLPLIYQDFSSNRRQYIHSLHQKYGSVVRLGPNEASFTSSEAVREIYASGGSGYDKTEFYSLFMQFGTRTMFSTLGKVDHSAKKRYVAGQYANTNITRPEVKAGIQDRADAFVRKCFEAGGTSVDAYAYLHCYALDCASHHLFGKYGTHSLEGGKDYEMMEEQTYHESLKSNLAQHYFPTFAPFLLKLLNPRPSPLTNNFVLSTCPKPDPSRFSLLGKLQESKTFSLLDTQAECMDHLAAGIDTTGDGLTFLMHQLSLPASREVQEKLRAELTEQGEDGWDDMPYLDAVIKEGLRCFPPIPMSQPRYVPKGGREIDGYWVGEGTVVSAQAWSVHLLNERIYERGSTFLPERWLDGDEEKLKEMNRLFFAFGGGGRGCVGRHLAMAEMKCLLKEVYLRFKTRVADDMTGSMDLADQIISSRPEGQRCRLVFEPLAVE